MKRSLLSLTMLGLLALGIGCSAPSEEEEEAAGGNSAVSTPRDAEKGADAARMKELQPALQQARPEYFGNAIHANVKPSIDKLVSMYMRADLDTDARAYSFIPVRSNKVYIIETHSGKKGAEQRNFYVYDSVGYPYKEQKPLPLGKCTAPSLKEDAPLTCKGKSESGETIFEP